MPAEIKYKAPMLAWGRAGVLSDVTAPYQHLSQVFDRVCMKL